MFFIIVVCFSPLSSCTVKINDVLASSHAALPDMGTSLVHAAAIIGHQLTSPVIAAKTKKLPAKSNMAGSYHKHSLNVRFYFAGLRAFLKPET